jgi:DNA-binding LacI/PurR family transcriptional regulator
MAKGYKTKDSITIKDVAQLASVAPSTVSKVLNGSKTISPATQARVQKAIKKLNYRPNSIARSLRKNYTRTIGIINNSHSNKNTFVLQMMVGVEEAAQARGFSVFLCNSVASQARERAYLEVLLDKQVDGVIFLDNVVKERPLPSPYADGLASIFLNQYTSEPGYQSILPDDYQGGLIATEHLIALGHKRIAYINGRLKHEASELRLQGYRDALKRAGLNLDSQLIQGRDSWDEESGYASAQSLIALRKPPSAIFCANDSLAIGALDALRELGLTVPYDVALVGFDNSLAAAQKRIPLTSIEMPFLEMGKLAADLLLESLHDPKPTTLVHRIPCKLIQRESCGAAAKTKEAVSA